MTNSSLLAISLSDVLTESVEWLEDNALAYGVVVPLAMLVVLI